MKTLRNFIVELFDESNREVVKVGISTLGIAFGMSMMYYFFDRIFG